MKAITAIAFRKGSSSTYCHSSRNISVLINPSTDPAPFERRGLKPVAVARRPKEFPMAVIHRLVFLALLIAAVSWPFSGRGQTGARNGEWRAYSAEEASTRYSPLDQITRDNVKNLEVAWTWRFDNYGSAAQTA